jgi:TPR repeat protein
MGVFFCDKVEEANRLIYAGRNREDFAKGFALLQEAVSEGDADAKYFLARCYCGWTFWGDAGLPEDEGKGDALMRAAVRGGSAVGALGAIRAVKTNLKSLLGEMPFASMREVYDTVLDMAQRGDPFCPYLIGGAYFWHDVRGFEDFADAKLSDSDLVRKSIPWYEKSVEAGFHWCALKLYNIYAYGEDGVPPNDEKRLDLMERLANRENPYYMALWAFRLKARGAYDEAFRLASRAADCGSTDGLNCLGVLYADGLGVPKDIKRAAEYYKSAAEAGNPVAQEVLGRCYFYGSGMEEDYSRAYYWLVKSTESDRVQMTSAHKTLGLCYFFGMGAPQDYARAKMSFEAAMDELSEYELYLLGHIYAEGLGTPQDIERGVSYLKAAAEQGSEEARAALRFYKKPMFGGWKRI